MISQAVSFLFKGLLFFDTESQNSKVKLVFKILRSYFSKSEQFLAKN